MSCFTGTFCHEKDVNYEQLLKALDVGWVERKNRLLLPAKVRISCSDDQKGLQVQSCVGFFASKWTNQFSIVLGEEHPEMLPNGEEAKAVTVQEGDSILITRIKSSTKGSIEIRRQFSPNGMEYIIRLLDSDLEAARYFRRVP